MKSQIKEIKKKKRNTVNEGLKHLKNARLGQDVFLRWLKVDKKGQKNFQWMRPFWKQDSKHMDTMLWRSGELLSLPPLPSLQTFMKM